MIFIYSTMVGMAIPHTIMRWLQWNHPRLAHWNKRTAKRFSQERHVPENNDVGSIYYPSLGVL